VGSCTAHIESLRPTSIL